MRQFFRELFCDHHYEMTRWHWTHGMTAMEPRQIEAEMKCVKCGKIKYWHITNPRNFGLFEKRYRDKKEH